MDRWLASSLNARVGRSSLTKAARPRDESGPESALHPHKAKRQSRVEDGQGFVKPLSLLPSLRPGIDHCVADCHRPSCRGGPHLADLSTMKITDEELEKEKGW